MRNIVVRNYRRLLTIDGIASERARGPTLSMLKVGCKPGLWNLQLDIDAVAFKWVGYPDLSGTLEKISGVYPPAHLLI